MRDFYAKLFGRFLALIVQLVTAPRAEWRGIEPSRQQRIYYANHTSNGDLPMIWTALPPPLRAETRPVAAAEYWLKNKVRKFVGAEVFRAILIDRRPEHRTEDPIETIVAALDEGSSIIIFPEGQRNASQDHLLPFKAGLYNMAKARPEIELVPVWISNLNKVMPKGEVIPVPLICTVTFGTPIHVKKRERKDKFIERARAVLSDMGEEIEGK